MSQDPKPTWKNTFNSELGGINWGFYDFCRAAAFNTGYSYYTWNGWVYKTESPSVHEDCRICRASDLDQKETNDACTR